MPDPDLTAAYALETPEDNRKLYADWAGTYDAGFASDMAYDLPRHVAEALLEAFEGEGPVLDVGAGTGLLAAHLPKGRYVIDGLDISAEMLAVAAQKGMYRQTIVADLTQRLDLADEPYAAVVSSGTFTHGHVGPEALDHLLRVARQGAVFALSINAQHFAARGFAAKFEALEGQIKDLRLMDVAIYGAGADPVHQEDRALIAVFRKV